MMETWEKCNTFLRRIEEGKRIPNKDEEKEAQNKEEKEEEMKNVSPESADEVKLIGENSTVNQHGSDSHRSCSLDGPPPSKVSSIHCVDVDLPTRLLALQCVQLSDCSSALSALRCRLIVMESDVDWVKESRW